MTKMETKNRIGNQKTKDFDVSRLTREYFYPDIVSGKLEEIKIPAIQELVFIGHVNILNLKGYFRGEEKKLALMQAALRYEITSFDERIQALQMNSGCDWRGYGYYDDENDRAGLTDTCSFGRFTTSWCERIPCSHCDHDCHEMSAAPLDIGQIGNPAMLTRIETTAELCQFYDVCRGQKPFLDEPCVLLDPEKQTECKAFLATKLDEILKRKEIMQKYMHNLTYATKKTDKNWMRPEFFEYDNFVGSSKLNMIAVLRQTGHGVNLSIAFRKFSKIGQDGQMPTVILKATANGWEEETITEASINEIYLSWRDFLYLLDHKDFRRIWIEMSNFWPKNFTCEELTKFFAQFDDIRWVD